MPTITTIAASPENYFIGKGIVSWKPDGAGSYTDLGNAPVFEFTPALTNLDHFSSRTGVKSRDKRVVTEKTATVNFTLEEFNSFNLTIALLGTLTSGGGTDTIDIFHVSELKGSLKLVGTNDIGANVTVIFPTVTLQPKNAIAFIGDTWGQLQMEGDVAANSTTGVFGTVQKTSDV